jgi:carbon storage regulator
MLVLTRKTGERINIGDNIQVTVASIDGDRVKLGIDAPRKINVWRSELQK